MEEKLYSLEYPEAAKNKSPRIHPKTTNGMEAPW